MIEVVIICENVLEADRMVFLIFEAVLLRIAASEGLRKFDSEMLDVDIQADRTPFASPRGIIVMLATSAAVLAIFLVHQLIVANAAASQLNRLRFQSERLHLTLERTTAVAQQADRRAREAEIALGAKDLLISKLKTLTRTSGGVQS